MKYKNSVFSLLFLAVILFVAACETPKTSNTSATNTQNVPTVKAQSPTEAYKMLFAAVKAKDAPTIKALMSKNSLGLAELNANNQKITLEKSLENGLVAPTLSPALTEIRDERIKDKFGYIEVFNQRENRWEDLAFIFENEGWRLAVGDLMAGNFDPQGTLPKGKGQTINMGDMQSMPTNNPIKMPEASNSNQIIKSAPNTNETKSVEVPKEIKPKK